MVMDAYDRRCAITRDKALPALDAAHIRPFHEHESHEVTQWDPHAKRHPSPLRPRVRDRDTRPPFPRQRSDSRSVPQWAHLLRPPRRPIAVPEAVDQQTDRGALEWHS